MKETISNNIIFEDQTIKDALIRLNEVGSDLTLFVVDNNGILIGSVTDGDIRRAIVNDISIFDSIRVCVHEKCRVLIEGKITIDIIKQIRNTNVVLVPIVNNENKIIDIVNIRAAYSILPVDAILMAGGRGERLKPFTDKVPKPLLQVGGIPIIERNIDRLIRFGVNNISIAIKYLGNQLVDYFKDGSSKKISISYLNETTPLGTIGAVKLKKNFKHNDVLIMNSDLLTNIDFEQMYEFFKDSNADMLVASTSYTVNVPYAVLETNNNIIKSFKEKPSYSYHSNAGIYLLKKEIIDIIPSGEFYNATDLIEDLIEKGKKVVQFPILGYWLDIGKHEDFEKAQQDVERIKF